MERSSGMDLEHAKNAAHPERANGDLEETPPETHGLDHEGIGDVVHVVDVMQPNGGGGGRRRRLRQGSANGQCLNPSEFSDGISSSLPEIKTSKKAGSEKKGQPARNGPTTVSRNQKAALSKSLTFPPKAAAPANGPRKGTTHVKQLKPKTKGAHPNGAEVPSSAGSNGVLPSEQTDLLDSTTPASVLPSLDLKSSSADLTACDSTSEALRDTTPRVASQRKSTGSGFSFRLDERAEKRKEFFQKLEEKIQAKEAEETNLQAKSKESQEAEIKQLRKSLTFKAKPMPTFYKEPGPPKLELKKIPTTRAISPKLGRHKPSLESAKASYQVAAPSTSTEPTKSNGGMSNGNEGHMGPKKLNQKSHSKLPCPRSTVTRPGMKVPGTKPKSPSLKDELTKADAVGENANEVQEGINAEAVECVGLDTANNSWDEKGGEDRTVSLPNPDIVASTEVSVQG